LVFGGFRDGLAHLRAGCPDTSGDSGGR
jgi:hypothetical protein